MWLYKFIQNIIMQPTWYGLFWLAKKCVMISVCIVDASCSVSYCSTGCTIQLTQLECLHFEATWQMMHLS